MRNRRRAAVLLTAAALLAGCDGRFAAEAIDPADAGAAAAAAAARPAGDDEPGAGAAAGDSAADTAVVGSRVPGRSPLAVRVQVLLDRS